MPSFARIRGAKPWLAIASTIAIAIICLHWAKPGTIIAQIDLFPNLAPFRLLTKSFWSWGTFLNANGIHESPAATTFYLVTGILQSFFGQTYGQIAYLCLVLTLTWWGVYRLSRYLEMPEPAAALSAWLFTFNPYGEFYLAVFFTATVLAAALPWTAYIAIRAAQEPTFRRTGTIISTILAFAVYPIIAGTPQLLFEFLIATLFFAWIAQARAVNRPSYLRWLRHTTLLSVATSLWWIVPIVIAFFGNHITRPTSGSDAWWVYRDASFLNILRLTFAWTWKLPEYFPYSANIDARPILYGAQFLLVATGFFAMILVEGRKQRLVGSLILFAGAAFFLAKGSHEPFGIVNQALMSTPPLFLFLEPAGIVIAGVLALALCAGLLFSRLQVLLSKPALIASGIAIVGLAYASAYPLYDGSFWHGPTVATPSMHVRPPHYWAALGRYASAIDPNSIIVVAPENESYQAKYDWGYEGVDLIANEYLSNPVLMLGAPLTYINDQRSTILGNALQKTLADGSPLAAALMRGIGARFVIFREDLEGSTSRITLSSLARALPGARLIRFGPLSLFALPFSTHPILASNSYIESYGNSIAPTTQTILSSLVDNNLPHIARGSIKSSIEPMLKEMNVGPHEFFAPAVSRIIVANSTRYPVKILPQFDSILGLLTSDPPRATYFLGSGRDINAVTPNIAKEFQSYQPLLTQTTMDQLGDSAALTVMNPSFTPTSTMMSVSIATHDPVALVLRSGSNSYSTTAVPFDGVQTVTFRNVRVFPGLNDFSIIFQARRDVHATPDPANGGEILNVAFWGTHPMGRAPIYDRTGLLISLDAVRHRHIIAGIVPVSGTIAQDPILRVSLGGYTIPYNPGVIVPIKTETGRYLCFAPLVSGINIPLRPAISKCLHANHVAPSTDATFGYLLLDLATPPTFDVLKGYPAIDSVSFERLQDEARVIVHASGDLRNSQRVAPKEMKGSDPRGLLDITVKASSNMQTRNVIQLELAGTAHPIEFVDMGNGEYRLVRTASAQGLSSARKMFVHTKQKFGVAIVNAKLSLPDGFGGFLLGSMRYQIDPRHDVYRKLLHLRRAENLSLVSSTPELSALVFDSGVRPTVIRARSEEFALQNPLWNRLPLTALQGSHFITLRRYFSWSWQAIAIRNRHIELAPHFLVNGWANGWYVDGDSTIIMFNVANDLQLLFIIAGAILIGVLLVKREAV